MATLHGKVDQFIGQPKSGESESQSDVVVGDDEYTPSERTAASRNALEILIQLGESRPQSVIWIDQVMQKHPDLEDPQEIITEVFNLKASV